MNHIAEALKEVKNIVKGAYVSKNIDKYCNDLKFSGTNMYYSIDKSKEEYMIVDDFFLHEVNQSEDKYKRFLDFIRTDVKLIELWDGMNETYYTKEVTFMMGKSIEGVEIYMY